jgi:hypothetical protein
VLDAGRRVRPTAGRTTPQIAQVKTKVVALIVAWLRYSSLANHACA